MFGVAHPLNIDKEKWKEGEQAEAQAENIDAYDCRLPKKIESKVFTDKIFTIGIEGKW